MTISCTRFKPYQKNTLLGFATIFIDTIGMEINSISVHQKGNEKWLSFPSRESIDNGEKKYWPYIYFPEMANKTDFTREAMKAIDEKINQNEQTEMF